MIAAIQPYLLWIKLAAAAIVMVACFGAGWTTRSWKCEADLAETYGAQLVEMQLDVEQYKSERDEQERLRGEEHKRYNADKLASTNRINALEEEIRNAPLNTVTPRAGETSVDPDMPFNREFLRLWNSAVDVANGVGGEQADGPEVPRADTTVALLTREDVLQHFKKVAGLFRDCKLKQNYAIEYDRRIGGEGASP